MIADAEELPTLTPKQTAFVNALLQGKTASDAYREAYNCENMSHGGSMGRGKSTPPIP